MITFLIPGLLGGPITMATYVMLNIVISSPWQPGL